MLSSTNPLQLLNQIIDETTSHIHDFTNSPADFIRHRKLSVNLLIKTILNMHGNSLNVELFNAFPNAKRRMSSSAFEQQKSKLKPSCFEYIFKQYNRQLLNTKLHHDKYHIFAIDGSDFTLPWNPNSKNVCNFSKNKPYCQVHVNVLYDLINKTYQDCIMQPRTCVNERDCALTMLKRLPNNSIVIMDRGYNSFNMIENCNRFTNNYYIIRARTHGEIKEIEKLPECPCDREISCRVTTSNHYYVTHKNNELIHCINHHWHQYKTVRSKNTKDQSWDFGVFCTIKFRACKFQIGTTATGEPQWEVLITNLPADKVSLSQMRNLYHLRWGVETAFRQLKYDLGSVQFHSKKDDFIEIELYAHLIMFNLVSTIINMAYVLQVSNRKYEYAINFKMATTIVRHFYKNLNLGLEDLLVEIAMYISPVRPNRSDQRKVKPKSAVSFIYRVA